MRGIIEAEHLRKTFGEVVAVDDVSFPVNPGGRFGILGPNRAGEISSRGIRRGRRSRSC